MSNKIEEVLREVLETPFYENSNPNNSAVLIFPGGGLESIQDYRISEGTKNWPTKGKYLWVAGTRGDPFYTRKEIIRILENSLEIDSSEIENQGWANHTLDQSIWATELLKKNKNINHVILATAAYHTTRSTLTFLKTLKKQSIDGIVISPIPISHRLEPSLDSEKYIGEMERILKYQGKGDAATLEEWRDYLQWRKIRILKK